jgi:hypothetical protein
MSIISSQSLIDMRSISLATIWVHSCTKIASTPEKALGVATVGQAVDWRAGNLLTHEHLTSLARREGDGKAVIALSSFAPSLATTAGGQPMIDFSAVKIQRQWLEHFNIGNVLQKHTAKVRWFTYLTCPTTGSRVLELT